MTKAKKQAVPKTRPARESRDRFVGGAGDFAFEGERIPILDDRPGKAAKKTPKR